MAGVDALASPSAQSDDSTPPTATSTLSERSHSERLSKRLGQDRALEGIANVIQSAPDGPRILAGDFNEPILIRLNGEIITSGQQIAADGSVRLG